LTSLKLKPVYPISNANKLPELVISNGGLVIWGFPPSCNCTKSAIGRASSVYGNDVTWLPAKLKKYKDGLFLKKSEWIVGVFVLSMIQNDIFLKLFQFVRFSSTPGHSSNWNQNNVGFETEAGIFFNFGDSKTYKTSMLLVHSNKFSSSRSTFDELIEKLIKFLKHLKLVGKLAT